MVVGSLVDIALVGIRLQVLFLNFNSTKEFLDGMLDTDLEGHGTITATRPDFLLNDYSNHCVQEADELVRMAQFGP